MLLTSIALRPKESLLSRQLPLLAYFRWPLASYQIVHGNDRRIRRSIEAYRTLTVHAAL
jgi:hypothetical protein